MSDHFDEEPDGDPHADCAHEIDGLHLALSNLKKLALQSLEDANNEARAQRSWGVARENYDDDSFEAKAYEKALLKSATTNTELRKACNG